MKKLIKHRWKRKIKMLENKNKHSGDGMNYENK